MKNKKILILIGEGKSTLTDFFLKGKEFSCLTEFRPKSLERIKEFNICHEIPSKKWDPILKGIIHGHNFYKNNAEIIDTHNCKFIFHLQDKEQLSLISLSIRRRANIFYLDISKGKNA